jgi:hypothetical protein
VNGLRTYGSRANLEAALRQQPDPGHREVRSCGMVRDTGDMDADHATAAGRSYLARLAEDTLRQRPARSAAPR